MTDTVSGKFDLRAIGRSYWLSSKIGSGSSSDIYLGIDIRTGLEVAIKLESVNARYPRLEYESRVYKALRGLIGMPLFLWYGSTGYGHNALVLELLGSSLEELFNLCNRKFTLKTVLLLADQMISHVEYIHSQKFIHCDITPENFVMGIGSCRHHVNIIDFGCTKKFRDRFHIPYRKGKPNLTGNAWYTSINAHLGIAQSRRDDLESLAYVLMYFLHGSLPWQGMKGGTRQEKYDRIMDQKIATTQSDTLCRGIPPEFGIFLDYARALPFDGQPDYLFLRNMFHDLFVRQGFQYDQKLDWSWQWAEDVGSHVARFRVILHSHPI
ncbi:kinase-like domain-containing protein [Amanita rubescens]|nr:kinase-like domain-containing protein [Amanita rubescens]